VPADGIEGLRQNFAADFMSGLLVSLIALPLCLGIAVASGFPAFGGVVTAIIGGLIVGPLCGSALTIKGPAAGLIAIAIGSVEALGAGDNGVGYRATLAVIVVASAIQIVFAALKLGRFGNFFPLAAVHGMLVAIGVIIFSKQIHPLFGVKPSAKEPLALLAEIPHTIMNMNPEVAIVGFVSVAIVVFTPMLLGRWTKVAPPALIAVFAAIGLSLAFDLPHPHDYMWGGHDFKVDDRYLVNLPANFLDGVTLPDFSQIFSGTSLQFIVMFAMIGSIESLLTVKAIDGLDPYRRKANLNRDLFAVGAGNLVCGMVGGLPMISEVVRSSANVSNGAKTRLANVFHGMFLTVYAVLLVSIIHLIPLSALAGILCVTGFRLASPKHFAEAKEVGMEQFAIFVVTILVTLSTDLLIGVGAGIFTKFLFCLWFGATPNMLFTSVEAPEIKEGKAVFTMPEACCFSNIVGFKAQISAVELDKGITLDFSNTILIDHTFVRELTSIKREFGSKGRTVCLVGYDKLSALSHHPEACRRVYVSA
jgi:MFS superfamily sulfate permease-like transporter